MVPQVTKSTNNYLKRSTTDMEIEEIIFCINPSKSPSKDDFQCKLFQDTWNIIKQDVCRVVKFFCNDGYMLKSVNHTLISLIPKMTVVEDMKQLRPISLYFVFYKIISKILSRRLSRVIGNIYYW